MAGLEIIDGVRGKDRPQRGPWAEPRWGLGLKTRFPHFRYISLFLKKQNTTFSFSSNSLFLNTLNNGGVRVFKNRCNGKKMFWSNNMLQLVSVAFSDSRL